MTLPKGNLPAKFGSRKIFDCWQGGAVAHRMLQLQTCLHACRCAFPDTA